MTTGTDILRNDDRSRYELRLDGDLVGIADFLVDDGRVVVPHTEISNRLRGQGLGAVLVRGVLDDIRSRGRSVVPRCWFVADFIEGNPEYADLVA